MMSDVNNALAGAVEPKSRGSTPSNPVKKRVVPIDPLALTETLGFQTFRRESRKPWTKEEDSSLNQIMHQLYQDQLTNLDFENVKWEEISRQISPHGLRKPKDCRKRWANSLDPALRKGRWTSDEDERLIEAFRKFGASWQKVSSEITGRTDDQCAKRYIEVLDPNTKDRLKPWTHEEDLLLIRSVKSNGTKWRTISSEFKSRPSLTCRNRWRKILTDVVRGKADAAIKSEVDQITNGNSRLIENMGNKHDKTEVKLEENLDNETTYQDKPDLLQKSQYSENPAFDKAQESETFERSTFSEKSFQALEHSQEPEDMNVAIPTSYAPSPSVPFTPGSFSKGPFSVKSTRPSNSEVEWRYTLAENEENFEQELPHKLFHDENGGVIKNQELVQQLIVYAKRNDLEITVHQHIHHHYAPPVEPHSLPMKQTHHHHVPKNHEDSQKNSSMRSPGVNHMERISAPTPPSASYQKQGQNDNSRGYNGYYLEPETQLTRYQHFNYLPPLTEVPKLTSSASSPSSSKGSTHHHYHHHHHHHSKKKGEGNSSVSTPSKESDLMRLLNNSSKGSISGGNGNENSTGINSSNGTTGNNNNINHNNITSNPRYNFNDEITDRNPLTPLTQAVEMAAAVEAAKRPFEEQSENLEKKKARFDEAVSDEEEGVDFWETMRNLSDFSGQPYAQGSGKKDTSQFEQSSASVRHEQGQKQHNQRQLRQQVTQSSHNHSHSNQSNTNQSQNQNQQHQKQVNQSQNQQMHSQQNHSQQNNQQGQNQQGQDQQNQNHQGSQTRSKNDNSKKGTSANDGFEIEEMIDDEALNSYGLFYNVYTREGSVLPQEQQPQPSTEQQGSVYDAWGGGFGIIPFNPS